MNIALMRGLERLDSLAADETMKVADWDTYGANPLQQEAVDKARSVLESLPPNAERNSFAVPTNTGNIEIEWHQEERQYSIGIDGDSDVGDIVDEITAGLSHLGIFTSNEE